MKRSFLLFIAAVSGPDLLLAETPPAARYLDGIGAEIEAVSRDLPRLTQLAERAAAKLLAGGELYAPPVETWWAAELTGRAGGPMRVERDASKSTEKDVAVFALPHPGLAEVKTAAALQAAIKGKADLYVLGPESMVSDYQTPDGAILGGGRRLACLGGPNVGTGLFPRDRLPPLAPYRPVIELVRGWVFIGEVVAACTRGGKMPTMWESIALPGSRERNAAIKIASGPQANQFPLFHLDRTVPPLPAGQVGKAYLDAIRRYLEILRKQTSQLAQAGEWMAQARKNDHRVVAMAQGHCPALIIGLHDETQMPIDMYPGDYVTGIVPHAKAGDAAVAFCYLAMPVDKVIETLREGCKVILAYPYGLPKALEGKPGLLWLDLGWQVGDAAVAVPGYDVKILPASAVMQMSALYAMVAEMAGRTGSESRKPE
ncbi:MAG: hypothetical protein JXQ73_05250 [Phycisphaerae bacterium]|nr:hypothetical protein [Phycisphaerae bacterium]